MYDLVLKEGMWHEIAFSEGKRRRSFFQVAVSGWEKQRNGYRMGSGSCRERGPPEKSVVPSTRFGHRGTFMQYCPAGTPGLTCCRYLVVSFASNCPFDCRYCFLQQYLANNAAVKAYANVEDGLAEIDA